MSDRPLKPMPSEIIQHSGKPHASGRFKEGGGEDPFQCDNFMRQLRKYRDENLTQKQIAEKMTGGNTSELRKQITKYTEEEARHRYHEVNRLTERGLNDNEIAEKLGVSSRTVQNYRNKKERVTSKRNENLKQILRDNVEKHEYLDIGRGVETEIQVPTTRLKAVVKQMVDDEGYHVHTIYNPRIETVNSGAKKYTTMKVLTKEPDYVTVRNNSVKIRSIREWTDDFGDTLNTLGRPVGIDPSRVAIKYAERGGEAKDGVIEIRPGVADIDMNGKRYAQVRILVGEDRFLKGMAVYGNPDDFPKGSDILFNTNKSEKVPKMEVLKKIKDVNEDEKDDPSAMFGSTVVRQNKTRTVNIINEEGEWDKWNSSLSAQFLSKQPTELIGERLSVTQKALKDEFEQLDSLTHPVVKKELLTAYSKGLNSKAKKLAAKGLPGTKSHVILPFPGMKPNEIYAQNFSNGERVVLIRYPHAGPFELSEVVVNNNNKEAIRVLGKARDAVGIHPSVAKKLSGADFDGDTVYVVPNPQRRIKVMDSLPGLKDFDPGKYSVGRTTMGPQEKQWEMGKASNLITDMILKNAPMPEVEKAVKHSMVVIDAEKHKLDWKQSEIDHDIRALKRKYESIVDPDTGRKTIGGSTLISRAKKKVDLTDNDFDPFKYSSGTEVERLYANHILELQHLKIASDARIKEIKMPPYSREAANKYKPEIDSLKTKLDDAKMNAPRERQAQILTNKLFYTNLQKGMSRDDTKKLQDRSRRKARSITHAKGRVIDITPSEWDAIQSNALSGTKVKEILRYADQKKVMQYALPREDGFTSAKAARAQAMLDKPGNSYADVAKALGVSVSTIKRHTNKSTNDDLEVDQAEEV